MKYICAVYTSQQEKDFIRQAKEFLAADSISIDQIDRLIALLNYADWKYYVKDNPVLADQEYDALFKLLKHLEEADPSIIRPDSPTQRVAKGLNPDFQTVAHLVPMLSLDNSYNAEDLREWHDRNIKIIQKEAPLLSQQTIEYCVEPKFDGASISLVYEKNQFVRGATRGNGIQGDDITTNTRQIKSIPLAAEFAADGVEQIELRGEVVIQKDKFTAFNEKLVEQNLAPLANPRNAASGSLRMKDPQEVAKRNLDAFVYQISDVQGNTPFTTHYESLAYLSNKGFRTSFEISKVFQTIDEVIAYCAAFEEKRDDLSYEIDGLVIKVNQFSLQEIIGMTSHHPRWAMAYKFKARQASSKLLNIEYQVGRTGSITPVAKIEPVFVGGVTISSLSLFNEDIIKEKDLMIGDTVLIERAGDVIPYVVKSFPELRDGSETGVQFPTICPICEETLFKPDEEAVWRCTNINCKAQVVERIIHFASKDAMDIRGLGESNIRKFFELGLLNDIPGIYRLPFDTIKSMEGFGEKSVEKLQEAIEKTKTQPLHRLIFGLGIRYVGETTAKNLARTITNLNDLRSKELEELLAIEDVGTKVAQSIVDFFSHEGNIHLLDELEALGLNFINQQKSENLSGELAGKTFLFTGTLPTLKRKEAEEMAEAKGGQILSGVSTKLDYLVAGEKAGSKLEKAKKLGSINIISEEDFLKLIQ